METPIALGPNLKLIRKKWKVNQTDFAELLGVNPGKLSSYETGTAEPKIITLIKLEDLSGIPIYDAYTRLLSSNEIPSQPYDTPPPRTKHRPADPAPEAEDYDQRLSRLEKEMLSLKQYLKK